MWFLLHAFVQLQMLISFVGKWITNMTLIGKRTMEYVHIILQRPQISSQRRFLRFMLPLQILGPISRCANVTFNQPSNVLQNFKNINCMPLLNVRRSLAQFQTTTVSNYCTMLRAADLGVIHLHLRRTRAALLVLPPKASVHAILCCIVPNESI